MDMYFNYAQIRDKKGLSDFAVSKRSGVSPATISDWKTGKSVPNITTLSKIADALDVGIDDLLGRVRSSRIPTHLLAYYTMITQSDLLQELMDAAQDLDDDDIKLLIKMARRMSA